MITFNRILMSKCIKDKWEPLLNGKMSVVYMFNSTNCAACDLYLQNYCEGCPISIHSNSKGCHNTPIDVASLFVKDNFTNLDLQAELTAAIQMEIDYLNLVGDTIK